jgi:uncharacterized low-complexity protein
MSSKNCIKPAAAIVGAALVGSLSAFNVAGAAENPFGATQLESGYMQLASSHGSGDKEKEGKCGEGKCGEGKCGGDKDTKEGKCGEGKCGGEKKG